MKQIISFIILFSSHLAQADLCQNLSHHEGNFRLDRNNRSLQNARVQDQGAIGTCYANSSSLLLREALSRDGNPPQDISWLHLALINKSMSYTKPGTLPFAVGDQSILEGGNACYTVNAIRLHGHYCPLQDNSPDWQLGENGRALHLNKLFSKLEAYMTAVSDESDAEMELLKKTIRAASARCLLSRGHELELYLNRIERLLTETGATNTLAQFKKERSDSWQGIVNLLIGEEFFTTDMLSNTIMQKISSLKMILENHPGEREHFLEVLSHENMNRDLSICFATFLSEFRELTPNHPNACTTLSLGLDLLETVPRTGLALEQAILKFVDNPRRNLDFIRESLYPICNGVVPDTIRCNEEKFEVDQNNPTNSFAQNTNHLRSLVEQQIVSQSHPLSVSVCGDLVNSTSSAMTAPDRLYSPVYNFSCKSERHAMTMIGVRCSPRGDLEYLVQNSYGESCGDLPPYITCENGKYWLKEKDLIGNLFDASFIE